MARLVGVDLPRDKRVEVALTYIFGVGRTSAHKALEATGVNPENVVWIFCTARSGSTWMRSMLDDLVDGEVWEEPKVGRLFGEFYSRAKPTQLGRTNYVLGEPTREASKRSCSLT